ncbi:MAG: cysteine--tRNA ligase [Phycisphaerales bacterium]
MRIKLYNTLSRRIEDFKTVEPGVVRMYHCGPTVYDYAHIGNFRAFILGDLLRRFFEFVGYDVVQVMNITDVGHMTEDQLADGGGQDKMELAAQRLKSAKKQGAADVENPDDPYQVAAYFTKAFLADAKTLGLKIADEYPDHMPSATGNVQRMIEMIGTLMEAGHAYVAGDGAVYYDVASFAEYGRLSGNMVEALQVGAGGRIENTHQQGKRNPADFLLWKPDDKHLMKWPSPWGVGYPGWHIECSAMSLGIHSLLAGRPITTLDIHTGGEDNIFPHHECEIAQSTGATGKPFANYWLHTRHLMVEGAKMSKSKGNFHTVRDLLGRGVDPAVLRYELLRTHYRANANFTAKGLEDSERAARKLRAIVSARPASAGPAGTMQDTEVERAFAEALADDLNISAALGELFKWVNGLNALTIEDVAALRRIDGVLGVMEEAATTKPQAATGNSEQMTDDQIAAKCRQIDEARARKDYAASDKLRDELLAAGIEVQIAKTGTTFRRKMRL